jgi:anti-anti-sigma factor
MDLTVRVRRADLGTFVQVGGDLDFEDEQSFQKILLHVMRAYSPRLLLDLAGVSFMDCAGLRALLMTRRRAEMRKGSVRLVAASATVRRVINATGMKDIFPVSGYGEAAPSVNLGGLRLIAYVPSAYPLN